MSPSVGILVGSESDLPVMTENQTGKEVTFNDAMAIVDAAITEMFAADLTSGNVTLISGSATPNARCRTS